MLVQGYSFDNYCVCSYEIAFGDALLFKTLHFIFKEKLILLTTKKRSYELKCNVEPNAYL